MKLSPFFRPLVAVLLLGVPLHTPAQELPATGLQLPPVPAPGTLIAQLSRPAGLPGGPSPAYVSPSHLTLPAKPALSPIIASAEIPSDAVLPGESLPDPTAAVPEPLLQPANPLLPEIQDPTGDLPFPGSDLIPFPGSASAPGFIEIQDAPADPVAASPDAPPGTDVPSSDLAPAPASTADSVDPEARGPLFRVKGTAACLHARALGYRFSPAGGQGRRDGIHTVASQVPNVLTSEVHGPRMMQLRPSPLWTTPYIENTFYMFCDPSYSAVRLQPGWKIRGIQLKGPHWQWVACPKSGATTASFSVRLRAWKTVDTPASGTVVTLEGLTLEGPPGATDWKAAFPSLLKNPSLAAKR